jgi:hypothetical protein
MGNGLLMMRMAPKGAQLKLKGINKMKKLIVAVTMLVVSSSVFARWSVDVEEDPMTDEISVTAIVSTEKKSFRSVGGIYVYCSDYKGYEEVSLILHMEGRFDFQSTFKYRVDKNEPVSLSSIDAIYDSIRDRFLIDGGDAGSQLLNDLKSGSSVYFLAEGDYGSASMTVDLKGSTKAIDAVYKGCKNNKPVEEVKPKNKVEKTKEYKRRR